MWRERNVYCTIDIFPIFLIYVIIIMIFSSRQPGASFEVLISRMDYCHVIWRTISHGLLSLYCSNTVEKVILDIRQPGLCKIMPTLQLSLFQRPNSDVLQTLASEICCLNNYSVAHRHPTIFRLSKDPVNRSVRMMKKRRYGRDSWNKIVV